MTDLGNKFKEYKEKNKIDLNIDIFTESPPNGDYGVDVGYYLRRN